MSTSNFPSSDQVLKPSEYERLSAWMDRQALSSGPLSEVRTLTGGTQNIMVTFSRGAERYVLRRPPLAKRKRSDEVLLREARIVGALAGTRVPHARLIAVCEDQDVLGAAFYLMELIGGFNAAAGLPAEHLGNPALRHALGLGMVDALAAIGEVDARDPCLEGLGQPEGFLERQAPRWQSELESYLRLPGYDEIALPDTQPIAQWLKDRCPVTFTPGLMHGDYHLANVLFAPGSGRIAAVVDWELATIGDPLLDLGWLLESWPAPGRHSILAMEPIDNLTPLETMIERYAAQSPRSLKDLPWYRVLACYKYGILLEGTHARAVAGLAPLASGDLLHKFGVELIERALWAIETA